MKQFIKDIICIALGIMFALWVMGCGTQIKVKGNTSHEAKISGESKVVTEVVLRVDVSACESLDGPDQSQCIKDTVATLGDLVELIKSLSCKDQSCLEALNE